MRKKISGIIELANKWRAYERGMSSLVVFILGFPLIVTAFGFGIDFLRLGQARRISQDRLDVSVQAGAADTFTRNDGSIRLGEPGGGTPERSAINRAQNLYVNNTARYRAAAGSAFGYFGCPSSHFEPGGLSFSKPFIPPNQLCGGGAYVIRDNTWALPYPPREWNFCQPPGLAGTPNRRAYGIGYVVRDYTPTIFMRMAPGGPRELRFETYSEALIRQKFC